jgi:hypothetical protein
LTPTICFRIATKEGIDKRTIRAATESMSIDRHAGDTGEFDVYSESGSVYRVDLIAGSCSCPDDEHNAPAGGCKHLRRVEMETGQRSVPHFDRETDVEIMIAAREEYRGLGDSTVEHRPADDAVVVTDGGVATETATQDDDETLITGPHLEPPEQGGATYYRCEDCGRESLRRGDVERSEFHAEGCALR